MAGKNASFWFVRRGQSLNSVLIHNDNSSASKATSLGLVLLVGGVLWHMVMAGFWSWPLGGGRRALADCADDDVRELCGRLDADGWWDGGFSYFGFVV